MKTKNVNQTTATANASSAVDNIILLSLAMDQLRAQVTGLTPLGLEERSRLPKVTVRTIQVTRQRLEAVQQHPTVIPPEFDLPGFTAEVAYAEALQRCVRSIDRFRSDLADTLATVSYRTSRNGSVALAYLKAANLAKASLTGTVSELRRKRRPSVGNAGAESQPGTSPVPAPGSSPPGPVTGVRAGSGANAPTAAGSTEGKAA